MDVQKRPGAGRWLARVKGHAGSGLHRWAWQLDGGLACCGVEACEGLVASWLAWARRKLELGRQVSGPVSEPGFACYWVRNWALKIGLKWALSPIRHKIRRRIITKHNETIVKNKIRDKTIINNTYLSTNKS